MNVFEIARREGGRYGPASMQATQQTDYALTWADRGADHKAHGIDISEDEWSCHLLPQEIMADRAELLSEAAEQALVNGLKIDVAAAGPYRPDWKAIVESRLKLLHDVSQIHWAPGGARERERGKRDVRLDATLNLEEFIWPATNLIPGLGHNLSTLRRAACRAGRQPLRLSPPSACTDSWHPALCLVANEAGKSQSPEMLDN